MIETDAPFLIPRNLKPRPQSNRNEPAYLPHIAAEIAKCRGETVEGLGCIYNRECKKILSLGRNVIY